MIFKKGDKMFKKIGLWVVLVLCSLNLSGCVFLLIPAAIGIIGGVGIGIGTAKWMSDKLVEDVPYTYEKTIHGVKEGLKALNLEIHFLNLDVESTNIELFNLIPDWFWERLKLLCIEHDGQFGHIANMFPISYLPPSLPSTTR